MRNVAIALIFTVSLGGAALAQPATPAFSSSGTTIGDLLDNPQAKAVLAKDLPEIVSSDQVDMARGMTLKDIQQYAPDQITDAKLAQIDADLAKLPAK